MPYLCVVPVVKHLLVNIISRLVDRAVKLLPSAPGINIYVHHCILDVAHSVIYFSLIRFYKTLLVIICIYMTKLHPFNITIIMRLDSLMINYIVLSIGNLNLKDPLCIDLLNIAVISHGL